MADLERLRDHLGQMARLCDHDGEYLEPTPETPWDHCDDGTWCMRCEIEKARYLASDGAKGTDA